MLVAPEFSGVRLAGAKVSNGRRPSTTHRTAEGFVIDVIDLSEPWIAGVHRNSPCAAPPCDWPC